MAVQMTIDTVKNAKMTTKSMVNFVLFETLATEKSATDWKYGPLPKVVLFCYKIDHISVHFRYLKLWLGLLADFTMNLNLFSVVNGI